MNSYIIRILTSENVEADEEKKVGGHGKEVSSNARLDKSLLNCKAFVSGR